MSHNTIQRSQTHATFVINRTYAFPVAAVWHALSDNAARDEWFGGGSEFTTSSKSHDFRIGGRAVEEGQWHGGPRSRFEATYTDIVEHQRIVFTYDMWMNDQHMSTSLTTIVLEQDNADTRLTYTEQSVHLDSLDTPEGREAGTHGLLDNLAGYLTRHNSIQEGQGF
jgi:uncharacterized protein YndB with AHSA1/START domain